MSKNPSCAEYVATSEATYCGDGQGLDNYESYNDNEDLESNLSHHSHCSSSFESINKPIVVGYAFGPKKMSTMGMVLAEASRVKVIHEELEEDGFNEDDEHDHDDVNLFGEQSEDPSLLTSAALKGFEEETSGTMRNSGGNCNAKSTIITLGNSNDTDVQHIVRYFRSSCSSAAASASIASMGETTASTSTPTITTTNSSSTFNTYKQHQRNSGRGERNRFPVQISFVPLDPDQPLMDQHGGKFDLILHKLTEDILTCSLMQNSDSDTNDSNNKGQQDQKHGRTIDDPSWRRVRSLREYCYIQNPSCCLVDDPKRVQLVMSRSQIARVLQRCLNGVKTSSGIAVKSPRFVVVPECASNDGQRQHNSSKEYERVRELKQALCDKDEGDGAFLSAPLIVKPIIAAGTKQSHFMLIALKESALTKLPPKSIVQEFVNHDATLYKVYVLGDFVNVYKRHSLPNLPADVSDATVDLVEFDSQRPYPKLKDFGLDTESYNNHDARNFNLVNSDYTVTVEEVKPIVDVLRQAFGLELFGFDILMGSNSGECFVVDVNYFPSYKEVPNFPSLLAQYLTQRALEQRRKGSMHANASVITNRNGNN
mmetsp:Transcript_1345/g.3431  ORF Transcript_1345/g.3431 Transcript_1345/m.3431 type:complete len:596 (-) Transcript_1345:363-2150(-)